MKNTRWLIIGVIACVLIAVIAYFWTTSLMDSIFSYRSPLHNTPPSPGQPIGPPLTGRVVFVLIDALREDTSRRSDVMPFLNELRSRGAVAAMHSRPPSYSEPGYTVLLTGAWPDVSDGPTINLDYGEIPTWTQDSLFSAAHQAGLKTGVSGYYWFEKLIPQSDVDVHFYTPLEDKTADRAVVDAALPWLKDGGTQLILIHLDQVDYAGHHEGGPIDPRWNEAAKRADDLLREIVSALDFNQDTVLVVSDHGQIDHGGHGGQDPITLVEPFVLVGAGVKPGQSGDVNMVDVAPTLAALLGTNIPASSQGHVRTEMLNLSPERLTVLQTALNTQQSQLATAYQAAIGQSVAVQSDADVVTATQTAMNEAKANRSNAERWPRSVIAGIAAIIPAAALLRKRGRNAMWLWVSAVIYLVVFNARYAVIDGRTYSLSSVTSAMDVILYCAVTAMMALGSAWLIASIASGAFRRGARSASEFALGLTFVTAYLLLLPVLLHFALNGAIVTWALPDFLTSFLAFLSLTQLLMVAVLGLIFAGISAVIASFTKRPVRA
jgi:hypothetical protein